MVDQNYKFPPRCDLVVRGIGPVVDVEQTEQRFAKLFSLEREKAQRILAGNRVTVRTQLDAALAQKYVNCLEKMGVRAEAVLITEEYLLAKAAAKIKAAVKRQASAIPRKPAREKSTSENSAVEKTVIEQAVSADITVLPIKSRAIYYVDHGEESVEASAMHQCVEPFAPPEKQRRYLSRLLLLALLIVCATVVYVKRDLLMHTSIHLGASHFKH